MSHEIEVSVKFVVRSGMWSYRRFHEIMIERTKEALADLEANVGGHMRIHSFSLTQPDEPWLNLGRNSP